MMEYDHIEEFEFPNIIPKYRATDPANEQISKPLHCDDVLTHNDTTEESWNWVEFRAYSPMLDAWHRWNKGSTIEEKDLCQFLETDPSSLPLQLVKSYLSRTSVSLTDEDVIGVLEISDKLLLLDLVNYCKYRIQKMKLTEDNFLKILQVCSLYDFVHRDMKNFVRSHLQLLADMEGSETLTYDTVVYLLTDEELSYWSMEERFRFITKWCKACTSRVSMFPSLFDLIDLSCLDDDFTRTVVRSDSLVISSSQSLCRVEDALKLSSCEIRPLVLIGDIDSDKLVVVNTATHACRYINLKGICGDGAFSIPKMSPSAWTVLLPSYIVIIRYKDGLIVYYDMCTAQIEFKELNIEGNSYIRSIDNFLCNNDISLFSHQRYCRVSKKTTPGERAILILSFIEVSTVFIKYKDTPHEVCFRPLISFKGKIAQICALKSVLFYRLSEAEHIYCFNLATYALTKVNIPRIVFVPHNKLLSLAPLGETIIAVYQHYIVQCRFDENTAALIPIRKVNVDVGTEPSVTVATTEGALVRVDKEHVHVCDSLERGLPWKSFKYPNRQFYPENIVCYGILKRNVVLCHPECPHCLQGSLKGHFEDGDTDFAELKSRKELAIRERQLNKLREMSLYDDYDKYSDYDDRYDYNDRYDYDDDYNDYHSYDDGPRMIFLASDDEWVEEWW